MIELELMNWRSLPKIRSFVGTASVIVASIVVLGVAKQARAQSVGAPYPKMAAIDQYFMSQGAEVALARSAAPESISKDAEVLVLDRHGYRPAIKGGNGFVCAVQRSWTAGLDDPDFWNPKLRAPICFNQPAARSYLAADREEDHPRPRWKNQRRTARRDAIRVRGEPDPRY